MFKSVIKIYVEVCFCTKLPTHRTSSDYMLNPKHELIYRVSSLMFLFWYQKQCSNHQNH